jgi:hypothetical protein
MTGRKSLIGLFLLCASLFSVVAAANVFAAQRAVECAPGGMQFKDEHCQIAGTGFGHVNNPANGVVTNITVTNERTAAGTTAAAVWKLKSKLAGIATEVQCTSLKSEGSTLTNAVGSVSGTGTATFEGCTVTAPAGRKCEVVNKKITTSKLKGTTEGEPANDLKIEKDEKEPDLATVWIKNCLEESPPEEKYPVDGSLILTTSGSTASSTEAGVTAQGTLTFGGNAAGLEGSATFNMEGGNPLDLT